MPKAMKCGDVVPGCEYVARGQNEDEVLARAAEHVIATEDDRVHCLCGSRLGLSKNTFAISKRNLFR